MTELENKNIQILKRSVLAVYSGHIGFIKCYNSKIVSAHVDLNEQNHVMGLIVKDAQYHSNTCYLILPKTS